MKEEKLFIILAAIIITIVVGIFLSFIFISLQEWKTQDLNTVTEIENE